uniref:C2 domain-containing protein n=1 Tax=Gouania willdenowi TaxID=441366 RepID=A0A8C5EFW9_GOUWI
MLVFNLLMCAGLMLTLPHDSSQSCIVGTAQQCLDADFIPGTNLAGEGFDITKMERKGAFVLEMKAWKRKDETCTVCKNPYMENQLQKLPLAVLDWRALQVCKNQVTSSLHKSSESVVSSSLSFTEIKGGHSTVPDLLFSADKNPSAYKEWLDTVPKNPDVISYSLDSLHELLPNKDPARKNLRSAISHYILEHGLWKNCSNGCQIGVSNSKDSCACTCHNEQFVNQDCCPTRKGVSRVIITVQRASGLWGDHTTKTDGYVKVFFNGKTVYRTPVILNNNDPNWGAVVDLGSQNLHSGNKVRFEVWDQDSNWDDDLLGACDPDLSAGTTEDMCVLSHGQLFYKLEVKCGPSLGGDLCTDYKSSPMSPSLSKLYVSRHAHRIPNTILRKMVFLDEKYDNLILLVL